MVDMEKDIVAVGNKIIDETISLTGKNDVKVVVYKESAKDLANVYHINILYYNEKWLWSLDMQDEAYEILENVVNDIVLKKKVGIDDYGFSIAY